MGVYQIPCKVDAFFFIFNYITYYLLPLNLFFTGKENQNQGNKTEVSTKSKKNQKNKFDEDLDVDEKVDALMGSVFENFVLNQPPLKVDIDNVKDISVKGFSITTSNGNELFKDANLTLSYGHKYGLIGPNGRGKTTLLRHIGVKQFNVPDSLDIFYAEQEVVADQTPAVQAVMKADKEYIFFNFDKIV